MPSFPFTDPKPDAESFVEKLPVDPVIRSEFENGAVLTRARFTTVPNSWEMVYRYLSNTDKELIETFHNTTVSFGALTFTWTHPITAATPTVRFKGPPIYTAEDDGQNNWKVAFTLIEVP